MLCLGHIKVRIYISRKRFDVFLALLFLISIVCFVFLILAIFIYSARSLFHSGRFFWFCSFLLFSSFRNQMKFNRALSFARVSLSRTHLPFSLHLSYAQFTRCIPYEEYDEKNPFVYTIFVHKKALTAFYPPSHTALYAMPFGFCTHINPSKILQLFLQTTVCRQHSLYLCGFLTFLYILYTYISYKYRNTHSVYFAISNFRNLSPSEYLSEKWVTADGEGRWKSLCVHL